MPFILPDTFNREITEASVKVYKSRLNKLASLGFDNVSDVKKYPSKVIDAIKDMPKNDQRGIIAAIAWAVPLPDENPYKVYVTTHVNPEPKGGWKKADSK
jgi:hypothetical protein